jgi:hypothetical protein
LSKLAELYEVAVEGEWYVSTHVSDSIERLKPNGEKQSIMFMCSIARGTEKRDYICLENARLISVMHAAVPGVVALMGAASNSKDLAVRKALRSLNEAIEAAYDKAMKVGVGTWRDADHHGNNIYSVTEVAANAKKKLDDPNTDKATKRKLRRQLRKQRREAERAKSRTELEAVVERRARKRT